MYDFKEVVARSIEKIESYASHGTELSEARVFPRVHRAQKMHSQFRVLEYIRMRYYRLMGLKAPEGLDSINHTPNDEKGSRDLVMLPREQNTIDGLVGQWLLNLALESDEDEAEADSFSRPTDFQYRQWPRTHDAADTALAEPLAQDCSSLFRITACESLYLSSECLMRYFCVQVFN